jgi:hypothetical protein
VLDQLAVGDPPDVDLLDGEGAAGDRHASVRADVAGAEPATHDDLVAAGDDVLRIESDVRKRGPDGARGVFEPFGTAWAIDRDLVVVVVGVHNLPGHVEIAASENLERLEREPRGVWSLVGRCHGLALP